MPSKKDPPLTDEERARRIRELAAEAETSNDPAAFERAFENVVKGQPQRVGKRGVMESGDLVDIQGRVNLRLAALKAEGIVRHAYCSTVGRITVHVSQESEAVERKIKGALAGFEMPIRIVHGSSLA